MIGLKTIDDIEVFLWYNMSSFLSILTVDLTESTLLKLFFLFQYCVSKRIPLMFRLCI